MSIFTLKEIKAVKGKQKFYKLFKDGRCEFDEFELEAKQNYQAQINTVYAIMDKVANLVTLPITKFNVITPKKSEVSEYEFKSKDLRVYAIHLKDTGKIVIIGGYKNTQKNDINHFREIKNQFLNTEK
jgi:hypothetical protein